MTPPTWAELFRVFGRIGLLSFGGPAAQIALMHRELVETRTWMDEDAFLAFRRYLARHFPRTHDQLEVELVSGHSLLFRWPGSDPSLAGTVLLAHQAASVKLVGLGFMAAPAGPSPSAALP